MSRLLRYGLMLCLITVSSAYLTATVPVVNKWAWQLAVGQITSLDGEWVGGSLSRKLTIANLKWQSEESLYTIGRLSVQWQMHALLRGELVLIVDAEEVQEDLAVSGKLVLSPLKLPSLDATLSIAHSKIPYRLNEMSVSGRGFWGNYQLTATGDVMVQESTTPPVDRVVATVTLDTRIGRDGLRLEQLMLATHTGSVHLSGDLDWSGDIHWQGQLNLEQFPVNTTLLDTPFPIEGVVSGAISQTFSYQQASWRASFDSKDVHGQLNGSDVSLNGQAELNNQLYGSIKQLDIRWGTNSLQADGTLDDRWLLQAVVNAPMLSELSADLGGALSGELQLKGNRHGPEIAFNLKGNRLSWQQNRLEGLSLTGGIDSLQPLSGKSRLFIQQLATEDQAIGPVVTEFGGSESEHHLSVTVGNQPGRSGRLALSGQLNPDRSAWKGRLTEMKVDSPLGVWQLPDEVGLTYQSQQLVSDPVCMRSSASSLCLTVQQLASSSGKILLIADRIDTRQLQPFFPEEFRWQTRLTGAVGLQWQGDEQALTASLLSDPGQVRAGGITGEYQQLALHANLEQNRLSGSVTLKSRDLGDTASTFTVNELDGSRTLSGSLDVERLDIALFAPFFPEISSLNGIFSASGDMSGTLSQPLFYGKLSLTGGSIDTVRNVFSLSRWTTSLQVDGNRAFVDGSAKVGKGRLRLGGKLEWPDYHLPTGIVTVTGEKLDINYPGMGQLQMSPKLTLSIAQQMLLTGQILIPWGRFDIQSLPSGATTVSSDVVVVDGSSEADSIQQGRTGKAETPPQFRTQIDLVLGEDIQLDAWGFKANPRGRLTLSVDESENSALAVLGTLTVNDGRFRKLGQDLLIQEGTVIFQGDPSTPRLFVRAIRNPETTADDVEVGIQLSGSIDQPDWHFFSEPTMPENKQLSYFLRGSDSSDPMMGSEVLLMNLGINGLNNFISPLGQMFGLRDVSLGSQGQGSDTQFTVSGYVAPNLRLQYGTGIFSSFSEVKLRYQLMPQLYIQAVSGLDQAMDIFYRFRLSGQLDDQADRR